MTLTTTEQHYKMKRVASNATVRKLVEIAGEPWRFHTFGGDVGLSYHKCRFCDRGIEAVSGLWKYGIRHYACEGCRRHYAQFASVLRKTQRSIP